MWCFILCARNLFFYPNQPICFLVVNAMSLRKRKKEFRLRTTKFFLTYPQLPNLPNLQETALSSFENIFKMKRRDFKFLIATEFHLDGNPHLHVYLEFGLVQAIYSATKLDLEFDGKIYHGNYQAVKSPHATKQYIIKSVSDISELNLNFKLPLYQNKYFSNVNEHLYEVLMCEGQKAAVDLLYDVYPKEAIQRGSTLLNNLELASEYSIGKRKAARIPKYTLADFNEVPEEISDWLKEDKPLVLILFGKSGTGKTELAKALLYERELKSLFVRSKHALKEFRVGFHDAILLDDINPDEFTREELIHLCDSENDSQIKVLYGYASVPGGTLRIITTNRLEAYLKYGDVIKRRVTKVEILKPNFSIPSSFSSSTDDNPEIITGEIIEKKRRGRPPGSNNKSKKT